MKLPVKDCRVCIGKTLYPKIPKENEISKEKYLNSIRRVFKILSQACPLIRHRVSSVNSIELSNKRVLVRTTLKTRLSDLRRAVEMTKRINESKVCFIKVFLG